MPTSPGVTRAPSANASSCSGMPARITSPSSRLTRVARARRSRSTCSTCSPPRDVEGAFELNGEKPMCREGLRQRGKDLASRLGLDAAPSPVPGLDDFIAEVVHGGVWGRPDLALADRALCSLAVLSVLQRLASLKPMVATALGLGLAPRNVVEVFAQVGLYAGFATTEASVAVAQEVF